MIFEFFSLQVILEGVNFVFEIKHERHDQFWEQETLGS